MSYTLTDCALMFGSNFFIVFLLGLQSRNVVAGKYLAAVVTSVGISLGNFLFVRYAQVGDPIAFVLCAFGGCCGIASSIWFSKWLVMRAMNRSFRFVSQARQVGLL